MKALKQYINERLVINHDFNNNKKSKIIVNNKLDLIRIIKDRCRKYEKSNYLDNELDLTDIDVSNIDDMSWLFNCSAPRGDEMRRLMKTIVSIDVTGWNVSGVKNFDNMFSYCENLKEIIGLDTWDTSSAESFSQMFTMCQNIKDLSSVNRWNTESVNNLSHMFCMCSSLESIDVGDWKTKSVRYAFNMFLGCEKLKSVGDISNWNIKNLNSINLMFARCESLQFTGDLNKWEKNMSGFLEHNKVFYKVSKKYKKPNWAKR